MLGNSNFRLNGRHIAVFFGALALLLGLGVTVGGAFAGRLTDTSYGVASLGANQGAMSSVSNSRPQMPSTSLVISQIYGGGGNTGAPWQNDFIEIFNPTASGVSFSSWSVQYAATAGTTWQVTVITGTIPSGGYFLVQEAGGANGVPLPTPDAIGTIPMAQSNGKVALVSSATALSGSCPLGGAVVDFVGFGTANCFEGTGATIAPSNTSSVVRLSGGCQDTDENDDDFVSSPTITPRNSASPTNFCGGTATPTPTAIPTCGPGSDYAIFPSTGATLVPGTTDIGNHCSACTTLITLPFTYNFYNVPRTTAQVSNNGNIQFDSASGVFNNSCLPAGAFDDVILAYWDGLDTSVGITNTFAPGIYTSISGSSPNRIFNIEWRACVFSTPACNFGAVKFEVRLYEGQHRFDVVYDTVEAGGGFATIGVQRNVGDSYTQYSCNAATLSSGLQLQFRPYNCGEVTQTPTHTLTPTPSNTPSATRTPTITPGGPTLTPTITGTPTATHAASNSVVISEFRTRGSNGGNDEFIELYNKTGSSIDISGWKINGSTSCGPDTGTRVTITNGVSIPAYSHFLLTNSLGYTGTVPGDATYSPGISDDGGIGLLDNNNFVIDAAGMCTTTQFLEGQWLSPTISNTNQSYERLLGGAAGNAVDTNNNRNDFFLNPSSSNPQNLSDPPVPPCTPTTVQNSIQDFVFVPQNMTINQGDTVNWTNVGAAPHTATSDTGAFDSGSLATNDQFSFAFNTPGIYPYHCDIHPAMTGTITVMAGCAPAVADLVGHVIWQTIPQNNPRSALPITLTLKSGTTEVNFPQQTTDNFGFFTVSVSSLPNGTYDWRVQGPDGPPAGNPNIPGFLANCGTVGLSGAAQTNMENSTIFPGVTGCTVAPGCIRGGDADNTNIVNISDFNILKIDFNAPGPKRADFDNNNIVNISDFNLLKGVFNSVGCSAILAP